MQISENTWGDTGGKGAVDSVFRDIEKAQKARHRFYSSDLLKYLRSRGTDVKRLRKVEDALKDLERLLWCVDDTLDREFTGDPMIGYNEIVKVLSLISFAEMCLKCNGRKGLVRRGPGPEMLLGRFKGSLIPLIKTTLEEGTLGEKLRRAKNDDEVVEIMVEYLKRRAGFINTFAEVAECLVWERIDPKPFLYLRAYEKLAGDLINMERDRLSPRRNSVLTLLDNIHDNARVKVLLEDIFSYLYSALEISVDEHTEFLLERVMKEEETVRKILSTL